MNRQKKHTILNVIIVIATIMLMLIICSIAYEYLLDKDNSSEVNGQEISADLVDNNDKNEEKEEDTPKEETTENNESNDEYVGQEEKETESTDNDKKETTDEKAINLAKKEWGEDATVQFSIEEKKENKYYIAVKSNATVISWYEVNIDTWEISEFY